MIRVAHIKADYKQMLREPIMLFLLGLPLFLILLGKIALAKLPSIIYEYTQVNLLDYKGYIIGMIFLLIAGMLGAVTGFMMLDDKDARIYELMSITPLGREGYIYNRLAMPIIMGWVYGLMTWLMYPEIYISPLLLCLILILISIDTVIIGIILFYIADDKVKGLTYAKGLNIVLLFSLADLLNNPLLHYIAMVTPTYWVTKVIVNMGPMNIFMAIIVHTAWGLIVCHKFYR